MNTSTDTSIPKTDAPTEFPAELLNKKETAGKLKVTTRTIENWMRRGVIPFIQVKKVTLFCWPDVVKHLKANHQVCRRNVIP